MVGYDTGSIEKQVQLGVSNEGEEQVVSEATFDFRPVPVDQLGATVSDLHANGNNRFKEAYKV